MDRRFATFLALSALVLLVNILLMRWLAPQPGQNQPAGQQAAADDDDRARVKAAQKKKQAAAKQEQEKETATQPEVKAAAKQAPQSWHALGSLDETKPYRMLAVINNRGAALESVELNGPRYHDLEDRSGYLGRLNAADAQGANGCVVRLVGPGTPADRAGLKVDDVIVAVDDARISSAKALDAILARTKPGQTIELSIERGGKPKTLTAALVRRPLAVIRPETTDLAAESEGEPLEAHPGRTKPADMHPLSYLLTLESIDDEQIGEDADELAGMHLRTANWTPLPPDPNQPDEIAFEIVLPEHELRIVKTFSLAKLSAEVQGDVDAPAYHLDFKVEIENLGKEERQVAYRLDGPTGLPAEGWWYAYSSKIGRGWSAPGVRDAVAGLMSGDSFKHRLFSAQQIADNEVASDWTDPLVYLGVDAQYFASVLIPQRQNEQGKWMASTLPIEKAYPVRAGPIPQDKYKKKLVDASSRLVSKKTSLAPGGSLVEHFQIFAGPKRPELLAKYAAPYGLDELVYYGWFGWVSRPMLWLLHTFYGLVQNYGIAIIMLTVLVRSGMFPLSRKQALNAAKMQELQPEMKRLAEKYKGNMEQRTKAQQELYRKHNFHPLSGCLPAFIQLPIFLGLYRSLAVDIELRQAPLLGEAIRWCSNLAAPDMFWRWAPFLPDFFVGKTGWLGPYLNVLPLVTISLFIWQQKMFLPPPADEQAALQQKMMQYMMIFMGVMFFKVPSGLCLYFIASSLWGITERKLLPKAKPPGTATALKPPAPPSGNGSTSRKKQKERDRK